MVVSQSHIINTTLFIHTPASPTNRLMSFPKSGLAHCFLYYPVSKAKCPSGLQATFYLISSLWWESFQLGCSWTAVSLPFTMQCPCWLNADVNIPVHYAPPSRCDSEASRPPKGRQNAQLLRWSPLLFQGELVWRLGRCCLDNHILPTLICCHTDCWGPLPHTFNSLFSRTFLSNIFKHLLSNSYRIAVFHLFIPSSSFRLLSSCNSLSYYVSVGDVNIFPLTSIFHSQETCRPWPQLVSRTESWTLWK